jgi:hypothetical protein
MIISILLNFIKNNPISLNIHLLTRPSKNPVFHVIPPSTQGGPIMDSAPAVSAGECMITKMLSFDSHKNK